MIDKAGLYGQGNPQPRFAFPAVRAKFAKVVGETHLRCVLEGGDGSRIEAVAFRAAGQPLGDLLTGTGGMPIHVAGNLKRDTWGGRDKIEADDLRRRRPAEAGLDDRFGDSPSRSDWQRGRSVPIYASCAVTAWGTSPVLASLRLAIRRGCQWETEAFGSTARLPSGQLKRQLFRRLGSRRAKQHEPAPRSRSRPG